jgi:hypothetical protein
MKWLLLSARHAVCLEIIGLPSVPVRFRDHAQDASRVLGMTFSSSLARRQEGCVAYTHRGNRMGMKSRCLLNQAATGNKLETHPS